MLDAGFEEEMLASAEGTARGADLEGTKHQNDITTTEERLGSGSTSMYSPL